MSDELPYPGANRFVRPLPSNPNLDKQRKLAKTLARDYWRGTGAAIERVQALHPKPPAPDAFLLSDAQLVIARGYGFTGWAQLKQKIDLLTKPPAELFKAAVEAGDAGELRRLMERHPELASKINEPIFSFNSPAVHVARNNMALLDLLLGPWRRSQCEDRVGEGRFWRSGASDARGGRPPLSPVAPASTYGRRPISA